MQTGQVIWMGVFCRLVSRQVGEQNTCRLVLLVTVKTVSQTGQRRAMASVSSGAMGWSGDTCVHSRPQGVGLILVVAQPVGGTVDADDRGPVQEPVEHGRGDGGIPKAPAQSAMPTLVVRIVEDFRYLWLITWNRAEAPSSGSGR